MAKDLVTEKLSGVTDRSNPMEGTRARYMGKEGKEGLRRIVRAIREGQQKGMDIMAYWCGYNPDCSYWECLT